MPKEIVLPNSRDPLAANYEPYVRPWPKLPLEAFYGLAGEFVREACDQSEADPVSVLLHFLCWFGCCSGPNVHVRVGDAKHQPRLFVVTVGQTAKARKGTSAAPVTRLNEAISEQNRARITPGPMSSGEGLIFAVRDQQMDKRGIEVSDIGIADKRVMVLDEEFTRALKAFQREGNTLSASLRAAYDHGNLDPLVKNNPTKATGAHICITTHATLDELQSKLHSDDISGGTMNRFLIAAVRRHKQVSRPLGLSEEFLREFGGRLERTISFARKLGEVHWSETAGSLWDEIYPNLSKDRRGRIGALLARQEANTLRLALIYCLLDRCSHINQEHLKAALAVTDYIADSVEYLFGGNVTGEPVLESKILKLLSSGSKTLTAISKALGGNSTREKTQAALSALQDCGRIDQERSGGGPGMGQPATRFTLRPGFTEDCEHEIDEFERY